MDCTELNKQARAVLQFDDEDLEENRSGRLSPAQAKRLLSREKQRERGLLAFSIGAGIAGLVLLFFEPVLALLAIAVAAVAFGIRAINQVRRGEIKPGSPVETVSGPVELHRRINRNNRHYEYRVWAGVQHAETGSGRPIRNAEKTLKVERELFDALADGGDYEIHHFRGRPVAIVCHAVPPDNQ